jgi:hypothetical protein
MMMATMSMCINDTKNDKQTADNTQFQDFNRIFLPPKNFFFSFFFVSLSLSRSHVKHARTPNPQDFVVIQAQLVN